MFFKKRHHKKQYESNSPLKTDNYKGNILEDDTDLQERTKQSIESQDTSDMSNVSDSNRNEENQRARTIDIEDSDLSEDIDNIDINAPLKRLLKQIKHYLKRKTRKKPASHLNNDLAPSLGNESISESSLSKEEVKKKKSLMNTITNILRRNYVLRSQVQQESKNLKDVSVKDLNNDGRVDQMDMSLNKSKKINKEHVQQLADAINDIGESNKKGRWAETLSDTHVQAKGGEGLGR